jgi:alpha-L-fucosidase
MRPAILVAIMVLPTAAVVSAQPPAADKPGALLERAVAVRPSDRQAAWQSLEFTCFIHFGVNTFTGREWGTGFEDPAVFAPSGLDADQWVRVAKAAGMRLVLVTAKHHDGFCLWPTRYTEHSVASSPWRDGRGDVLRELADACARHGLHLGVYLSPADLYQIEQPHGLYGNGSAPSSRTIPRPVEGRPFRDDRRFEVELDDYNEYFMNQLFELLTEYGPIHEVWFDGAHPKRKGGQQYAYAKWYELIRTLAPEAVIAIKGPDVRWCGNEAGRTRPAEWSVIPIGGTPDQWHWPDMTESDLGSLERIRGVLADGGHLHWYPAETNTSIRHGWFYRDPQQRVRTADEVLDIWYRAVGGNTVFLLNLTPDRRGLIPEPDAAVLRAVGSTLRATFATNLADGAESRASAIRGREHGPDRAVDGDDDTCWMAPDWTPAAEVVIDLPERRTFDVVELREPIRRHGQRIASFAVDAWRDGAWHEIASGTTVGWRRLCRVEPTTTDRVRVRVLDARVCPALAEVGLYRRAR